MSDKKTSTYETVFKYIDVNVFELKAARFMADYEGGMRKAIKICFPNAILNGCWYHFSAAVRRRFLSLNLYRLIADSMPAQQLYRKILSLPLLPPEGILEGQEGVHRVESFLAIQASF